MRLHRITLRNFRGTVERTVTFDDGVTIVQGVNEAGKSSLMEGLRLLRQFKSSSNHSAIRAVKPVHRDEGPQVEAELSIGPHRVTYGKRWIRSPWTTLEVRGPRPESLTGEEAHTRFLDLLQEHTDPQLLEALEVWQGGSLGQPELVSLPSLRRALEEVTEPVADNDALMAAVQAEYQRYFTATGKPTGEYLRAERELEELQRRMAEASDLSQEVDELTETHGRLGEEHRRVLLNLQQATADLEQQREDDQRLDGVRERVATQREQVERAEQALARAEQDEADRGELTAALEAAQQEAEQARQGSEHARQRSLATETEVTGAREQLEEVERDTGELRSRIALAQEAARRHEARLGLEELHRRLERIDRAEEAAARAVRQFEAERVDPAVVERAEQAELAFLLARSRLEAAATHYRIEVFGEVLLDGETLPPGARDATPVSRPVVVEVPGQLRLEIAPDATTSDLDRHLRAAEQERADLFTELGVTSIEEARRRAQQSSALDNAKGQAETELRLLLGEDSRAGLTARAEALRELAERAEPDDEELATGVSGLIERLGELETQLTKVRQQHQDAQSRAGTMREEAVRASARADASAARVEQEQRRLTAARTRSSDEEVRAAVVVNREQLEQARSALAGTQRELDDSDAAGVQLRLGNATALVERLGREVEELEAERVRIATLLEDRMASGPYDTLTRARDDLDALTARQDARHRAARAAELLWRTLGRHRDQARLSYVAPFKQRIEQLGRPVFGTSLEVGVDHELKLLNRTLDGVTVPFSSLSIGAQEQLSLLGRLACAELVDPGEGAPVMIDDALGFADPERIRLLAAVLNDVGSRAQVVILTCQPERFGLIGTARVVRI